MLRWLSTTELKAWRSLLPCSVHARQLIVARLLMLPVRLPRCHQRPLQRSPAMQRRSDRCTHPETEGTSYYIVCLQCSGRASVVSSECRITPQLFVTFYSGLVTQLEVLQRPWVLPRNQPRRWI